MTTYSRTFEITTKDLGMLETLVYREQWTQSIFECPTHPKPVSRATWKSKTTVEIKMQDLESIPFEY